MPDEHTKPPRGNRGGDKKLTKSNLLEYATRYDITEINGSPIADASEADLIDAITGAMWEADNIPRNTKYPSRSAMQMLRRACENHYDIPDIELKKSPAVLMEMIKDPEVKPRNRVMAVKTLVDIRKFMLDQITVLLKIEGDDVDEEECISMPFVPPKAGG